MVTQAELLYKYFKTDNQNEAIRKLDFLLMGGTTDLAELVTRKFPYLAKGPFARPLPSDRDLEESQRISPPRRGRYGVYRVSDIYAVKVAGDTALLQVLPYFSPTLS